MRWRSGFSYASAKSQQQMRILILLAAFAGAALADPALEPASRGEAGVRYWLSTGDTKRSHNAQPLDPTLGNPTSVLLYDNLDANTLEVFGRWRFGGNWFVKGLLGVGTVNRGVFRDEDFNAGQVKFSDTTSSVTGGRIGYGTIDLGRTDWAFVKDRLTIVPFVGYGHWSETVDAYGATDHLGFIGGDIPHDVLVITNKVVWRSLRIGLAAQINVGSRTRLDLDVALIPYSKVRNDDSHHLRTSSSDLGPVPNIVLEGEGRGVQFEAELRHEVRRRTELGIGLRYWHLDAYDGERFLPNRPDVPRLPLVELYSRRLGITLNARRSW
jgi:hypothetical protein